MTTTFQNNPPFNIESAYYQDWVAGVQDGGRGTNIQITFKSIESDIVIQEIYFHGAVLEAKTTQQNIKEVSGHLVQGSGKDIIMDSDPIKETGNTPKLPFLFDLKDNEAVLGYWYKGKKEFYKVSGLEKKPMLAYPQSH